jgi:hypothetical protein
MRGIRALAAQSPAILLSLLALLFSLGGGAYAATTLTARQAPATIRTAASAITFHALHLTGGWRSGSGGLFRLGGPGYAVSGGVVYLTGALFQPKTGNPEFARLPRAAWPHANLFIPVTINVTNAVTTGTLYIRTNGVLEVFAADQANAAASTSLAGVSFPVRS